MHTLSCNTANMSRTPVYFLSHGGPTIIEDTQHPAFRKLQEIGREITTQVKPKAVLVFSAHWQAGHESVEINMAESTNLIYDFYGFPARFYEYQFPNKGSPALAQAVLQKLQAAGIKAKGVQRGLDHGVWASFACAFSPTENPLKVPVVQASLFMSDDPDQHYRLGQAVASLREEGILIIVSGMAVHNLRDFRLSYGSKTALPYAISFDQALKDAVELAPEHRQKAMASLLERPDARKAHPSFEHLLPIHVGAGAAGDDRGLQLWTLLEGCVSWAQYRFGEVSA